MLKIAWGFFVSVDNAPLLRFEMATVVRWCYQLIFEKLVGKVRFQSTPLILLFEITVAQRCTMHFYLCIIDRDALPKMDRVALVDSPMGNCWQKIKAASWWKARELIEERCLVRVDGYGWFKSSK